MPNRYDPRVHHRRSIRLPGYDYSQRGAYFVTLCAQGKECFFGEVTDGGVALSEWGRVLAECWQWLAHQYPYVEVDSYVVMPNHTHGIVLLADERGRGGVEPGRGVSRNAPTGKRKPLGQLVGAFKTVSTKRINELRGTPGVPLWQRNYYERVIRSEEELNRIREYIVNNPARWAEDEENPQRLGEPLRSEGNSV